MFNWLKKLKDKNSQNKNVRYMHTADLPVDRVIEAAAEAGLESITIVGWTSEGKMYLASSYAKRKDLLWDLSIASREVME